MVRRIMRIIAHSIVYSLMLSFFIVVLLCGYLVGGFAGSPLRDILFVAVFFGFGSAVFCQWLTDALDAISAYMNRRLQINSIDD